MKFTVSKPRNFREKKFLEETKELRFFCSTATEVLLLLEKDKISVTSLMSSGERGELRKLRYKPPKI